MTQAARVIRILAIAPLAGLAACGQQTLDTDRAEGEIARGISQQTGAQGVTVQCPADVKIEAGQEFECQAQASKGQRATVKVRQKDDKGNLSWQLNAGG